MLAKRVLGVLAGEDMPLEQLRAWVASADVVFAADGGAERLRQIGVVPDVTIGDLDSITLQARAEQSQLIQDHDQEGSDCDKLLALVGRLGHTDITLVSAEGDLLDHMLGTLHSALKTDLVVRLGLRRGIGFILRPSEPVHVSTSSGTRVSLLPLLSDTQVTLSGVHWPLDGEVLSTGERISLSNRATSAIVTAHLSSGAALLFVAKEAPYWPKEKF